MLLRGSLCKKGMAIGGHCNNDALLACISVCLNIPVGKEGRVWKCVCVC